MVSIGNCGEQVGSPRLGRRGSRRPTATPNRARGKSGELGRPAKAGPTHEWHACRPAPTAIAPFPGRNAAGHKSSLVPVPKLTRRRKLLHRLLLRVVAMSTARLVRRLPAALSHCTSSPVLASLAPTKRAKSALHARMASSASSSSPAGNKDWSAVQYLKFDSERTRAVHDLVARVPLPGGKLPAATDEADEASIASPPLRIVDLGCGPGNSTAVLVQRFAGAHVSGVDASPNMIERARAALPDVDFALADLHAFAPADAPADLLLANAVFQWLRLPDRLPTVLRLLATQRPGGVFAYQVPDNKDEPSHRAMGEVGSGKAPGTSAGDVWVPFLRDLSDRDPIETPETIYDALIPHCAAVDVWHTAYYHVLPGGVADIVEWLKGSGLQPFVNALPEGPVRDAYLDAYKTRLADFYKPRADGSVLIRYPRLFVVAVKK